MLTLKATGWNDAAQVYLRLSLKESGSLRSNGTNVRLFVSIYATRQVTHETKVLPISGAPNLGTLT